ncbi:MAG TPA: EF-hand domain-containing protein [Gemmataceae bacterium]|nr:EF-hand domain-containing protein [Gemmataceae bacterium]
MKTACALGLAGVLVLVDSGLGQGPGGGPPGGGFGQGGGGFRQRGGGGGGGGFDPAQMFDRFANGKEVWTRADAANNPWGQGMFDRIAQSMNITNGQITREQFTTYMQQQRNNWGGGGGRRGNRQNNGAPGATPGGTPANGSSPGAPGGDSGNQPNGSDQWAERMFQRLDANGDGLLNNDEMPEALRAEREKWDTNKDGFIDLNEYKAYFRAVMQQRMAEGGGWNQNWQGGGMPEPGMALIPVEDEPIKKAAVYRAGNLPKDIPSWFSQYDTDGDGQIGLYEWKATGESMEKFRQIDRNNDGFLTIDEVLRYDAEQKKNGGGAPTFGGMRVAGQVPPNNQGAGAFQGRGGGGNGGGGGRNRNRQGGN